MNRKTCFKTARRAGLAALLGVAWTPMAYAETLAAPSPVAVETADVTEQAPAVFELADLDTLTHDLTIVSASNDGLISARIRGIGTIGDNAGLESSVLLVVDGVARPRTGMGFGDIGDIERIDVLHGPQGVRYGRNAAAGVINVITKKPSYEPRFEAALTLGDHGLLGASASVSAGQDGVGAVRLSGAKYSRDGFTTVRLGSGPRTESRDNDRDSYFFRAAAMVEPSPDFTVSLGFDLSDRDENCCAAVTLVRGFTAPTVDALASDEGVAPVADPFARIAWSNRDTTQKINDIGGSLKLDWDTGMLGGARLSTTTSLRRWKSTNGIDRDFTSADMLYSDATEDESFTRIKTFYQSLELSGESKALDWMVGVSWTDERLTRNESVRIGSAYESFTAIETLRSINPLLASSPTALLFLSQASGRPFGTVFAGQSTQDRYSQKATSLAFYGEGTIHASDKFDLTLGLRYTDDDKELVSTYANPNGTLGCAAMRTNPAQVVAALVARGLTVAQASAAAPNVVGISCRAITNVSHNGRATSQTLDTGEWAGNVRATYHISDNASVFISASRGYKAGGFNLDRMQSNTGLQSGTGGVVPIDDTSFAPETVESYEMGANTRFDGGRGQFNITLFRQEHSNFQLQALIGTLSTAVRSVPQVRSTGVEANLNWRSGGFRLHAGMTYADTKYGNDALPGAELVLLPGARLSHAPEFTFSGGLGYRWDVGSNLTIDAQIDGKYTSSYNASYTLDPLAVQDGYGVLNAALAIGSADSKWKLTLWVRNLTDTDYVESAFDAPYQTGSINGFLGNPRTVGATLRVGF